MTPQRLAEIRARCEKAIPGPASIGEPRRMGDRRYHTWIEIPVHVGSTQTRGNVFTLVSLGGRGAINGDLESVVAEAVFIANAHTDIPDLLAYVAELEEAAVKVGGVNAI